jgi:hypothetical protein
MRTRFDQMLPVAGEAAERSFEHLQNNEDPMQRFHVFRDGSVRAEIWAPFYGREHKERVVQAAADLIRAVAADAVSSVLNVAFTMYEDPTDSEPTIPPLEDPRAQEGILLTLMDARNCASKLFPYGRCDHGKVYLKDPLAKEMWADVATGFVMEEVASGFVVEEVAIALSEPVRVVDAECIIACQRRLLELDALVAVDMELVRI